jgi:D-galacturonate reductase
MGIAVDLGCIPETEDTITLLVEWRKQTDPSKLATGVYTASWTAPQKAGVHSNQYFHCMLPPHHGLHILETADVDVCRDGF